MNNQLSVFTFQNTHPVRLHLIKGEHWFCLKDVCEVLAIANPRRVAAEVLDQKGVRKTDTLTEGGNQSLTFVNEPNLYRVIFRSNKPEAKQFQDWVFNEVLPSIRKIGSYKAYSARPPQAKTYLPEYRQARTLDIVTKVAERICTRFPALSSQSQQALYANLVNKITEDETVPLPVLEERFFSASQIGKMLGVTGHKIGRIANLHNLKTEQFGKYFLDTSQYSTKQVEAFRYNTAGFAALKEIIVGNGGDA